MFDFRYHVASLAAVFLALIVGIVIGVGLSGQGVVEESERVALNERIESLQAQLEAADDRLEQRRAAEAFVEEAYPAVMANRLEGRTIAVVFLGSDRDGLLAAIRDAVAHAGGTIVRFRALRVPADPPAIVSSLDGGDGLASTPSVGELGEALGEELVAGGDTPLWDSLAAMLVLERTGTRDEPADAVVVARTVEPQAGETARFLRGLYRGISDNAEAVWVDAADEESPRRPADMSVVQDVRGPLGRIALAVLLAGGPDGVYGVGEGADAVVPPIEPVEPPPPEGD